MKDLKLEQAVLLSVGLAHTSAVGIKLPLNQKRERTTGKKRLKGHGPGLTQYTRLHID